MKYVFHAKVYEGSQMGKGLPPLTDGPIIRHESFRWGMSSIKASRVIKLREGPSKLMTHEMLKWRKYIFTRVRVLQPWEVLQREHEREHLKYCILLVVDSAFYV